MFIKVEVMWERGGGVKGCFREVQSERNKQCMHSETKACDGSVCCSLGV